MGYSFNFGVVADNWDQLLTGAWLTLRITVVSIAIGLLLAALGAYQLSYGRRWLRTIWQTYIEIVRNTPLLAQLFLIFFGLPAMGLRLDANVAAVIALAFNFTAYAVDIMRAGIESVPRGQIEASKALALTPIQTFLHVVLKPALAAVYPALAAQCVLVLLGSAVISTISADDLSSAAAVLQSATFRPFEVYLAVTAIYLVMAFGLQSALDLVGRRAFGWTRAGAR